MLNAGVLRKVEIMIKNSFSFSPKNSVSQILHFRYPKIYFNINLTSFLSLINHFVMHFNAYCHFPRRAKELKFKLLSLEISQLFHLNKEKK